MEEKRRRGQRGRGKKPAMTRRFNFHLAEEDYQILMAAGGSKFLRESIRGLKKEGKPNPAEETADQAISHKAT